MPIYPTHHSNAQLVPTILHEPQTFMVCTTAWRVQLQHHASRPAWNTSHHPWKPDGERHVGIPWSKMMVYWSLDEPLLLPPRLCHQDKRRNRLKLCWVFPAQHSTPIQIFRRKYHHHGTRISLCPAEPSTSSPIFKHQWIPVSRNRATVQDIHHGGWWKEEHIRPSTQASISQIQRYT